MTQDPNKQLRSKIAAYVTGRTSLRSFRSWFLPASWDVAKWAPANLQELVYRIDGYLVEHENGHRSEAELRDALSSILRSYEFGETDKRPSTTSRKPV